MKWDELKQTLIRNKESDLADGVVTGSFEKIMEAVELFASRGTRPPDMFVVAGGKYSMIWRIRDKQMQVLCHPEGFETIEATIIIDDVAKTTIGS